MNRFNLDGSVPTADTMNTTASGCNYADKETDDYCDCTEYAEAGILQALLKVSGRKSNDE